MYQRYANNRDIYRRMAPEQRTAVDRLMRGIQGHLTPREASRLFNSSVLEVVGVNIPEFRKT